ncbi:transporter, CPA2 family [Rubellimicrobium thermophilum DSM 16684]|uniref:Transporter, CPA2 family n=1 Tax=Rubellimicrobium thermophilum DSM 16684 TaxID=1123069 RepID=S9SJR9_9RHOB|nr:cation:proton antiporter [Rubellimicrobium thermophilum]EPX86574.1 transporter, CPA2 family [Rubellimicrobium thermophilum DSM 16684]
MEAAADHVFREMAVLILLAAVVGLAGLLMRQPLVVGFIAVGILAGPDMFGIAQSTAPIEVLSQISIAVLLFLVGLKLDLGLVRSLGAVSLATGLGQVGFTAGIGFLLCLALGLDAVTSLYVAVALTFSSTIIIVKLLSDKREITALHGRIALGFLIVQDIVVVLAMVVLSALGISAGEGEAGSPADIARVLLGGFAMVAAVVLFAQRAASPILTALARSPELMVVAAVGWAAGLAAAGEWIGFGKELGGLLAGVSLASTPFRDAIGSRLSSLRDFLLLFFFIALGMRIDLSNLGAQLGPALVLSVFVLVGNPLIVMAIMGFMGYRRRTGFLAGLTVAQISEFSLIFMAMGVALGHVREEAMGLVTLVGLVTIALSVYMITWSHPLYDRLAPLLRPFERRRPFREEAEEHAPRTREFDVILFGLGRYGSAIGERLAARGHSVLGVDFDPEALRSWRAKGHAGMFGDITDPDFPAHLPLAGARVVVSAVPRSTGDLTAADPQMALLHGLRSAAFGGQVVLSADSEEAARTFLHEGATLMLEPFRDAAEQAAERIGLLLDPPSDDRTAA